MYRLPFVLNRTKCSFHFDQWLDDSTLHETGVAEPLSGEAVGQVEGMRAAGPALRVEVHVVEELAEIGVETV